MPRILIVEDDPDIAELLAHYLQRAGHTVDRLASGDAVLARVRSSPCDLVILDLMLPGMDGLAVCSTLRANPDTAGLPIVILTARGEESDRVSGLEIGADDYVTKPFSPREIVARVAARLRRQPGAGAAATGILRHGPIAIDAERHHVTLDGREIKLTAKEFLLLQYLIQHRGRVLSRDLLLTDVWGYQYTGGTRTVDVHIRRLREKLPVLNEAIETIKQFGYKLSDPVTFRTRVFLTSLAAAAVTLVAATLLASWALARDVNARVERGLVDEARLAAETLSHRQTGTPDELAAEAEAMGRLISARVTLVAPDGTVVGDSSLTRPELAALENHATRPEIVQARQDGLGVARRYSTTLKTNMLYVAVPVRGPSGLATVRLALPLTDIRVQLGALGRGAAAAMGIGLLTALGLAWIASSLLSRRVSAIAAVAERYASGDFSHPARDYGADEIATVARVLDDSARQIGQRMSELDADRARMTAILTGMIEGVLVVNDQGRLQLVNEAARRMLHIDGPFEGRHYLEIVRHPDVAGQIGAALAGAAGESLELSLPREPDTIFLARSAPIRSAAARGAVLVLHDITSLRKADRIRRDFVANVSHELRTPLTAISGYVEALRDGGVDRAEADRFLETIARHTARMERLVRDLLRLARLDAGQEPLDRLPCSVEALFTAVTMELSATIEARQQNVLQNVSPEAATVTGDPAKLHDVFRNLLENSINYSPERKRIVLGAARRGGRILLSVTDEGPGIPEADLPRIFERFYRADKARARNARDPGGTGLGLAIVKHLVELHGGTVRAENRREGGAVLSVELKE